MARPSRPDKTHISDAGSRADSLRDPSLCTRRVLQHLTRPAPGGLLHHGETLQYFKQKSGRSHLGFRPELPLGSCRNIGGSGSPPAPNAPSAWSTFPGRQEGRQVWGPGLRGHLGPLHGAEYESDSAPPAPVQPGGSGARTPTTGTVRSGHRASIHQLLRLHRGHVQVDGKIELF